MRLLIRGSTPIAEVRSGPLADEERTTGRNDDCGGIDGRAVDFPIGAVVVIRNEPAAGVLNENDVCLGHACVLFDMAGGIRGAGSRAERE